MKEADMFAARFGQVYRRPRNPGLLVMALGPHNDVHGWAGVVLAAEWEWPRDEVGDIVTDWVGDGWELVDDG